MILEIKVSRTKRPWCWEKDGRVSQREFLEKVSTASQADALVWIYNAKIKHRAPYGPDEILWFAPGMGWKSMSKNGFMEFLTNLGH